MYAKTSIDKTIKCDSGYIFGNTEFNLLKMYKDTIMEAFNRHKDQNIDFMAVQLGISGKQLYRFIDQFGLRHLVEENKNHRRRMKLS